MGVRVRNVSVKMISFFPFPGDGEDEILHFKPMVDSIRGEDAEVEA